MNQGNQVYLAGPRSEGKSPYHWHKTIQSQTEWNAINPFTCKKENATGQVIYQKDLDLIRASNAILLHRVDNYEICGAYIEVGYAGAFNIPTVVHNEATFNVPNFLEWHAVAIESDLSNAIEKIEMVL